jgi:predicted DNA-binding transcriptional regulator AlpA
MKSPKTAPRKRERKAPARRVLPTELHPDYFYRVYEAGSFFGYSNTVLHLKIESGEIPPPVALSKGGRARGWFGRTIIAWQAERKRAPKLVVGVKKAVTS